MCVQKMSSGQELRKNRQLMGFGTVQPSALPQYLTELQHRHFLRANELFLDIGQLFFLPSLLTLIPSRGRDRKCS
jgi:hypothetical protein